MATTEKQRADLLYGSTWEGRSRLLVQLDQMQGSRPDLAPGCTEDKGVHGWVDRSRLMEAMEQRRPEYPYAQADLYYLLDEHLIERHPGAGCVRLSESGQSVTIAQLRRPF